jgi:hypothetical protein
VLLPRVWRVTEGLPQDAQGKVSVRALRALLAGAPARPERLALRRAPGLAELDWRVPAERESGGAGQPTVAGVLQLQWVMDGLEELLGAAPAL